MSMLGLIPQPPGRVVKGQAIFKGRDLLKMPQRELRKIRGGDMAMIFQDPMTSLNPVLTIGNQIGEAVQVHNPGMSEDEARAATIQLLELVGVPFAERRVDQYPHEFSGGMRQRAMIAMAIANDPSVLIADEPTTALDVTIQAQIVEVLKAAREETHASIILITHDLGLIAELADRVVVMYAGRVVELGDVYTIFNSPRHPYTLGLLNSLARLDGDQEWLHPIPGQPPSLIAPPPGCAFHPRCELSQGRDALPHRGPAAALVQRCRGARVDVPLRRGAGRRRGVPGDVAATVRERGADDERASRRPAATGTSLLRVEGLVKHFPIKAGLLKHTVGQVQAVDGVDLDDSSGRDAGRGRRVRLRQDDARPNDHEAARADRRVGSSSTARTSRNLGRKEMRAVRREIQIVFQDPYASLNPRMTVREIVAEPLRIHGLYRGKDGRLRVEELLRTVGLSPEHANRFPHEFSGGQRQRIGVARALA